MPVAPLPPSEPADRRSRERMAPLAKLPVFWDLNDKPVIVAGGSDAAAWKAELLAACGAHVHVFAPVEDLGEAMRGLLDVVPEATPPSVLPDISPSRGEIGWSDGVARTTPVLEAKAVLALAGTTGTEDGKRPRFSVPISPLEGEMSGRTEGGSDSRSGQIHHHSHSWHAAIFTGAALAIGDCETEEEAQAFFDAARLAGVPVNVIDKPAYCQFQFGSIVNRSPVVVAISTDGAAPILAQAIRRRIETLLPPALKGWAELAQALRDQVNDRLAPGPLRRRFWEGFVDRCFSGNNTPEEGVGRALLDEATRLSGAPATGRVTLVGAGPGDAELLTLKAVRALQAADVILFDDLVSGEVLELARREARRLLVGKRGGRTSCSQQDINDMMVNFAKAGKRVVRLKSGDPMIFGRAGEEIARLEREGIAVDVVPGITAASAMAARLGVSLTHRDHAQSVRFVTGHSRHGDLPAHLDWRALADPATTTVFYMGGRTAAKIEAALLEAGMPDGTPVVIVTSVTRDNETRWAGTVEHLASAMAGIGVDQPVLIGVGNAFSRALSQASPLSGEEPMAARA